MAELQSLSAENLKEHRQSLRQALVDVKAQHKALAAENEQEPDSVKQVQLQLLNRKRSIIGRAIHDLRDTPELVLSDLKTEAHKVLEAFSDPKRSFETPQGKFAAQRIQAIYNKSSKETQERYKELDTWYALGNEFAIDQEDSIQRAYKLTLIPQSIQHAKWRFMLALADAAYNINFEGSHPDRLDDNNIELLSRLYAQLSQHERGADNPHMPYTHKLRHNPAIHSLHVVALADKIFHDAEKQMNGKMSHGLKPKWQKIRDQVMLAALVHDCGELEGELSQGIIKASMSKEEAEKFEYARNKAEANVFARYLEQSRPYLHHMNERGRTTDELIDDKAWQHMKAKYIEAFELAEHTDTYVGRFIKVLERMQSQHDYLRFEGINGAPFLKDTTEENRKFSMNYVASIYKDSHWNATKPGKNALVNQISKEHDPDKKAVFTALSKH